MGLCDRLHMRSDVTQSGRKRRRITQAPSVLLATDSSPVVSGTHRTDGRKHFLLEKIMVSKRVKSFAGSVADSVGDQNRVGFIEWLVPIITIITNLPCLKPKSPAEVHQWITDKPKQAVTQMTHQIMAHSDNDMRRKQAKKAAAESLAKAAAMSQSEFVKAYDEARAA